MTLGSMNASIEGGLLAENRFDLDITAAGPDASVLTDAIGQSMPADPFSVSTHLAGGPEKLEFTNLDVTLGISKVFGNLTVGLGETKRLSGNLESPHLDLRHWDTRSEDVEEKPDEPASREWMFDDTPVANRLPQNLNVDAEIKIDELIFTNTTVFDIALGIAMEENFLDLKPLTFRGLKGGSYVGEVLFDARGLTPKLHFAASGKDVRSGFAAAPGQDPSTYPPFEYDIRLDGSGVTRRNMASSLDGKIRMYIGSGQVAEAGLSFMFSDFLTQLFTKLNPFLETSEYTQFDCGVFAADAVNGKVAVFPVIINTEQLTILSKGTVDLGTEEIDLSFNTKPRKGLGITAGTLINPLIKVGGRLTSPAVELDPAGTVTSTGLA
ncbi:AsmA-like C-terminal region-containing protein, partial [Pseudomonadota bacterium]